MWIKLLFRYIYHAVQLTYVTKPQVHLLLLAVQFFTILQDLLHGQLQHMWTQPLVALILFMLPESKFTACESQVVEGLLLVYHISTFVSYPAVQMYFEQDQVLLDVLQVHVWFI